MSFLKYAQIALGAVGIIKDVACCFMKKSDNQNKERLQKVFESREEEYRQRELRLQEEINNLREMIEEKQRIGEENRRRELEKQQEEIEKEKLQNQEKIKQLNKQREAILNCKDDLAQKYLSYLTDIFQNYEQEESKIFIELNKEISPRLNVFKINIIPQIFKTIFLINQIKFLLKQ